MSGVPGEELSSIPGEERLGNLMQLIEAQRGEGWESRLQDILDSFEDFLTMRPEPPQAWKDTYAASGKQFDYYQIVLPKDFEDPYEDDLGNIRRLRSEFERTPSTMALEHELISRNYFIYENGHAEAIPAPRPLLIQTCRDDRQNGPRGIENVMEQMEILRVAYRLLGAERRLIHEICDGGHRWHGEHLRENLFALTNDT